MSIVHTCAGRCGAYINGDYQNGNMIVECSRGHTMQGDRFCNPLDICDVCTDDRDEFEGDFDCFE